MIHTKIYLLPILALLPYAASAPGSPPGGHHGPPPPSCPGPCLATSLSDFTWDLSIEYHAFWYFTTPAHQNSWGTVTLNLSNPAVPAVKTLACGASSDRLSDFFYGDQWYPCASNPASPAILDTSFRFFSRSRVDVNQTWVCDEDGLVKFAALATAPLNMTCTDVSWTNPNWTYGTGEFYSTRDVKCAPVSLRLKPNEERILL
ncbi:hypothetical protein B0H67DRAFT_497357 [Lasiosphaeris hirsuta]|uniref:AA1-like domain-containing protein n=1 Tax=Lasiosphaeris hirsuta TaxID=260670 RepID=A0AA40DJJ4_9PEZI|nr:hypothetical protein B0H67DRAFT_497357 [Lasiosphaeris hirsuta]